jgi:hypothetical protein
VLQSTKVVSVFVRFHSEVQTNDFQIINYIKVQIES